MKFKGTTITNIIASLILVVVGFMAYQTNSVTQKVLQFNIDDPTLLELSDRNFGAYLANQSSFDLASGQWQHCSHFGACKTASTIPIIEGNFPGTTLDAVQWVETSLNSASLTVSDGQARIQSGTNSSGSVELKSRLKGIFQAGQVTVFQSGVRAGAGLANNTRIWGMRTSDEQDGLYFKLDGTTFQVCNLKAGSESCTNSASFSGDTSFSPGDTNNTYRIEYSAGRAIFYSASGGKKNFLHALVDSQEPLVNDLDLGLYYENTNSGNTTDVSMYVRGSSISVWGSIQKYNRGNALVTTDFSNEVALNTVSGYQVTTKFGRNPDVDTGTDPEDMWNGGSTYTGFNATAAQNFEIFSADVDDQGQVVTSGTATGGSETTIIDSTATFVTDGVAVGDMVVNDTKIAHGSITSVDSETQLTVFDMNDGQNREVTNVSGDAYRIVNANDTGAALVRVEQLLDGNLNSLDDRYVVLNGTTGVLIDDDIMRASRAKVILAGSSGLNEGVLTGRQASTTANVFMQVPTVGRTTIGAFTIPAEKIGLIKRVRASITRANGSAGSATINLNARGFGEAWNAIRSFEVQTGAATEFTQIGGDILRPGTDVKFTIQQVSDNSTISDGALEYYLMDL